MTLTLHRPLGAGRLVDGWAARPAYVGTTAPVTVFGRRDTSYAGYVTIPNGGARVASYSLSSAGYLTGVGAYLLGGASTQYFRFVVFDDVAGEPDVCVASTGQIQYSGGDTVVPRWRGLPLISGPVWLPAATYWLGAWCGASNSQVQFAYATGATGCGKYSSYLGAFSGAGAVPDWSTTSSNTNALCASGIYIPRAVPVISAVQDGAHIDVEWA